MLEKFPACELRGKTVHFSVLPSARGKRSDAVPPWVPLAPGLGPGVVVWVLLCAEPKDSPHFSLSLLCKLVR